MFSIRSSSRVLLKASSATTRATLNAAASKTFTRSKYSLPELDYEFSATEPYISGQINEIHYTKHHQTYVNNLNASIEQAVEAKSKGEVKNWLPYKSHQFQRWWLPQSLFVVENLAPVSRWWSTTK